MAGRKLTPEDDALWAAIKKTVRPLDGRQPASADKEPPAGSVRKYQTVAGASDIPQSPKPVSKPGVAPRPRPAAPGPALDRKSRRRLARGRADVEDRLDLHGLTQAAAFHALVSFLRAAQADGKRLVLVITGKGRAEYGGFGEGGILRATVPKWLAGPEFKGLVAGIEEAGRRHGGEGALYVRLRRRRPS